MKNKMLQLFLFVGLIIGLTGLAQAQTGLRYQADIPFDFTVAGKSFKAGEYSIKFGFVRDIPSSFLISSADGKEIAVINNTLSTSVFKPNENARIVFDRDGDGYALAEIKTLFTNIELTKTRKKQKSARVAGAEISMVRK